MHNWTAGQTTFSEFAALARTALQVEAQSCPDRLSFLSGLSRAGLSDCHPSPAPHLNDPASLEEETGTKVIHEVSVTTSYSKQNATY
jgi:hypothetical protein